LVFYVFITRVYLTFVKAVTLILKHATLLQNSKLPKAALTNVDLNYQKANIDESIQQFLIECASELSVEQFAGFIMGTDIGLFIIFLVLMSPLYLITLLYHIGIAGPEPQSEAA
jgi:hypothetical protein